MRKLLNILGAITLIGTAVPAVVANSSYQPKNISQKNYFNFVENYWWNKKNHQYDNLKNNFV